MRILIDGDATPSIKLIEEVAIKYQIEVLIFKDDSHVIESDYSKVITVSTYSQSVDINLTNEVKKDDIVITSDFGVAVVSLSKGAYVLNSKGFNYDNDNINILLEERHLKGKLRKQGIRIKGPKKRSREDDNNLIEGLEKTIKYIKDNIDKES